MKTKNLHSRVCWQRLPMTLVEVMFALAVASLVFAMLYNMLAKPLGLWHKALAQWQLEQESRLLRERMLRGIESSFGLREAERNSIKIQPGNTENVEWIDFYVDNSASPGGRGKYKRGSNTARGRKKDSGGDWRNGGPGGLDRVKCRILENPAHSLAARTTPGSGKFLPILDENITCEYLEFTEQGAQILVRYTLSIQAAGETYRRRTVMVVTPFND